MLPSAFPYLTALHSTLSFSYRVNRTKMRKHTRRGQINMPLSHTFNNTWIHFIIIYLLKHEIVFQVHRKKLPWKVKYKTTNAAEWWWSRLTADSMTMTAYWLLFDSNMACADSLAACVSLTAKVVVSAAPSLILTLAAVFLAVSCELFLLCFKHHAPTVQRCLP